MGGSSSDTSMPYFPYGSGQYGSGPGAGQWVSSNPNSQNPYAATNANGTNNGMVFGYNGMPVGFPTDAISQGIYNYGQLYNSVGNVAPGYYQNAETATNSALNNSLNNISGVANTGLNQMNNVLNNYDQSFVQSLGPTGNLGQQLMGEYNNYGITPSSGAFQQGLGNTMAQLGSQNALTLGEDVINPAVQQGLNQAGTAGTQNMSLGSQGALSPLSYMNQALSGQSSLVDEATQLPVDWWSSMQNANLAQLLGQQTLSAQNSASNAGLLGSLGGAGISGLSSIATK